MYICEDCGQAYVKMPYIKESHPELETGEVEYIPGCIRCGGDVVNGAKCVMCGLIIIGYRESCGLCLGCQERAVDKLQTFLESLWEDELAFLCAATEGWHWKNYMEHIRAKQEKVIYAPHRKEHQWR